MGFNAGLDAYYYGQRRLTAREVARHLAGAVLKDSADDAKKLKHYFDVVVARRSKERGGVWQDLWDAHKQL